MWAFRQSEKGMDFNMKLGLSLSGGGVKGAAHIGVIKALEEKNDGIFNYEGDNDKIAWSK